MCFASSPCFFHMSTMFSHTLLNTISRMYLVLINEHTFLLLFSCSHGRFILQGSASLYVKPYQFSYLYCSVPFSKSSLYQLMSSFPFSDKAFWISLHIIAVFVFNGTFSLYSSPLQDQELSESRGHNLFIFVA